MEHVQGPVQGSGRGVRLRWTDPLAMLSSRGMSDILLSLLTSVFPLGPSEVAHWSFCISLSIIHPNCACMHFFSVPYGFFVFCCWSRCNHRRPGSQVPTCLSMNWVFIVRWQRYLTFTCFFLVPLIFRLPCRVFFLFLHNYQVLLFFPPSPSWFLLWNLSW